MPTTYIKKDSGGRGKWSEDSLEKAIKAITDNGMGVNAAAKCFNIPKTTLKRRIKTGIVTKGPMGPSAILGENNELKIVGHIKKLQDHGFTPSRSSVRSMAYELAETLKLNHNFNREEKMAGYDWLQSFLKRNPSISIRKSEGVSVARANGMTKTVVRKYFQLLEKVLNENGLINKPLNIYNMDETGLQLNNKPGEVLAIKGSKNVTTITSGEKGETVSVLACVNGEGTFLPPFCIMKGKNIKKEFTDGMPPGSEVRMSQKSAYVNSDLFLDWLKTHFIPRKPIGKVLLLLDGHTSHTSCLETLVLAEENDIILMSLPPHTSHWLQPLDRSFFKSLKSNFYAACNRFMVNNPSRMINRLQFGTLLNAAWSKSASVDNGTKGFLACGIIPLDIGAIPEYAYLSEEGAQNEGIEAPQNDCRDEEQRKQKATSKTTEKKKNINVMNLSTVSSRDKNQPNQCDLTQAGCSKDSPKIIKLPLGYESPSKLKPDKQTPSKMTPSKLLEKISPVPSLEKRKIRKNTQTVSKVLNSAENISKIKQKKEDDKIKEQEKQLKRKIKSEKSLKRENTPYKIRKITKKGGEESTSESEYSESELVQEEDDDCILEEWDENECVGCGEIYNETNKKDDWVKCVNCSRWFHEGCSRYEDKCDYCGKRDTLRNKIKLAEKIIKKEKV